MDPVVFIKTLYRLVSLSSSVLYFSYLKHIAQLCTLHEFARFMIFAGYNVMLTFVNGTASD